MPMRLFLCGLIWMQWAVWARAADAPPARIAVIGDTDDQNLTALVTAELSDKGVAGLVDREDLVKLGDELRLQQLASQDTVRLGKLVGADGLLFLSKAGANARVRLTAVGFGYALFDDQVAVEKDPARAARLVARLVAEYAPKLRLDPGKAVPISVLNLRAEYATAQSTALERNLTLLLESRLAAVPEYVVLERRHAGSLGFERSLDPAARPLLPGSYLVDGSLGLPPAGTGDVTVRLRVMSSKSGPQTLEIHGGTTDLPGLSEKLAVAIRQATGHVADPGEWQPEKEAREYLLEALWAWQHHLREAAWEAADSARLLGERAADLTALEVDLLLDRAGEGIVYSGGLPTGTRPVTGRPLDERTDDLLRAISEAARYADERLEAKLQLSNPRQNLDVRGWEMQKNSIRLGTELLACLDDAGSPRADEVRQTLRVFTGYDPLEGKPGTHSPASPWLQPEVYTDRWAASLEEALAWLRLSCTVPEGYVNPRLVAGQGEGFCRRFLRTPEQQKAAFGKFFASLRDDPTARLAALVIQTGTREPAAADAACQAYLDELWPRREALAADQPHRREWTDLAQIPEPVRRRQAARMIPLLRYYLAHATSFQFGTYCIRPLWLPQEWSADEAVAIWADYQGCKGRMEQDRQARRFNVSWLDHQQAELEDPLLKKFPALAARAPGTGLVATRFWHPWRRPGNPAAHFLIADAATAGDSLFVLGEFRADGLQAALYRIAGPGLETETADAPERMNAQHLEVTPDAVYVDYYAIGSVPAAEAHRTGRFDRAGRTWSTAAVTPADANDQRVNGETFVHLPGALGRMNPSTGGMDLLISDRRKPPRNPLDNHLQGGGVRVFAGPGNRPCVSSPLGVFYVREEPGDWPEVFDASRWTVSVTQDGQTLVLTSSGEVVLIDPTRAGPEYLMAPAWPHYRKEPPPGQKVPPTATPWQGQTYWDAPGKEGAPAELSADRVAWRGDRFFVLLPPAGESQGYTLLAYTKGGGRTPRRVPLEFRLDAAARQTLAPIYRADDQASPGWTVESIEHPGPPFFELRPIADRQGLWLVSHAGGIWFIPYTDLDDYLKNHPATPDRPVAANNVGPAPDGAETAPRRP